MENKWPLDCFITEKRVKQGEDKVTIRFASIKAIYNAAVDMVVFYKKLNQEKCTYVDHVKENLVFDMMTGRLCSSDRRNTVPFGEPVRKSEILNEYSAPELILGKTMIYTEDTQNWMLSVLLFELFFHAEGPYCGVDSVKQVYYEPEEEFKYMAEHAVYVLSDEKFGNNRPVHGIHDKINKYKDIYPVSLMEAFQHVFTDGKKDKSKRLKPSEWEYIIKKSSGEYISCDCGYTNFVSQYKTIYNGSAIECPRCGRVYRILESERGQIYLQKGQSIYSYQLYDDSEIPYFKAAEVVENTKKKGVFGIKNLTGNTWRGIFPNGEEREILPKGGIPIWSGLEIILNDGSRWKIKGEHER